MPGDGRTGQASVTVDAEPAVLWSMVTDITRMGEWSPENEGGEWIDGADGAEVGARFKGRNRRGRSKWSSTCEVTESEPGRSFAFRTGSSKTEWRYRFEPVDGGTRVTESYEVTRPVTRIGWFVIERVFRCGERRVELREGMQRTLSRLGELAAQEAGAPTP